MAAYTLYFSDPTKSSTIIVPDSSIGPGLNNYDTSLDLVGSGYTNYGQVYAQNFLKLLETFAGPNAPSNAIEGQLWYDTSNPNKKVLRVNNGTLTGSRWQPASGIYQQSTDPAISYSSIVTEGDIWVDTGTTQVKMRHGLEWVTVGPSATSGLTKTGSEAVLLESNTNEIFPVILNWSNGKVVEIISYNDFTPRSVIDGFVTIRAGSNLTTKVNAKYNGTAKAATSLEISPGVTISAGEVLKSRATSQTYTGTFIIESGSGLFVQNSTFNNSINLYNNANGGFINFTNPDSSLQLGVGTNSYIRFNGANSNIGINTSTTSSSPTLDINGSFRTSGISIINSNLNAISTTTGALQVRGGASFGRNVWVNGQLNVLNNTTITGVLTLGEIAFGGVSIIQPANANQYDIGSSSRPFRHIFAETIGVTGTNVLVHGDVKGYANRLEIPRNFIINGQVTATVVSFNGTANAVFTATLTRSAIDDQVTTSTTSPTQTLLVLNTSTSTTSLEKISKVDFLSDVYAKVMLPGMMIPYGSNTPPSGFLLCNGMSFSTSSYSALFGVIGYTYGGTAGTFFVPNMANITTATGGYPVYYIIKT